MSKEDSTRLRVRIKCFQILPAMEKLPTINFFSHENFKEIFTSNEKFSLASESPLVNLNPPPSGLKITITGIARCGWKKGKGKSSIKFEGRQVIFESHQFFFGNSGGGEPIDVSTGIHIYRFSCIIPANAVSSHHGTHGAINYKVNKIFCLVEVSFIGVDKISHKIFKF